MYTLPANLKIAPGKFGVLPNLYTDLFLCDSTNGNAQVRGATGTGQLSMPVAVGSFPVNASTEIVTGIFANGTQYTDLALYDPVSGSTSFYTTNGLGSITPIGTYPLAAGRKVVSGNFGLAPALYSDLLLYDAASGLATLAGTNGFGGIGPQINVTLLAIPGGKIVTGIFAGGTQFTDLLLYNPTSGVANFYTTPIPGNIVPVGGAILLGPNLEIVSGRFGGPGPYSDLLLYNVAAGTCDVRVIPSPGTVSGPAVISGFPSGGTKQLISGTFAGGAQYTDFMFYDPASGQVRTFTTNGFGNFVEI